MAVLGTTGGIASAGQLAAITGTASADQSYVTFNAESSGLYLDVSGASTAPNGLVIQWYPDGGANQNWSVPAAESVGRIRNQNSGMCLTTDGVAGDQLYQKPCLRRLARYQRWSIVPLANGYVVLANVYFNLVVDVYGNSGTAGAPIDAWPYKGQPNQQFAEAPVGA
jgi:hypothetical protein